MPLSEDHLLASIEKGDLATIMERCLERPRVDPLDR
jgi:hypothetical protein